MSTRLLQEYPSLATLSETDLKDLLVDETFLQAVLYETPPVRAVLEEQERLMRENDELAKRNSALQSELVGLRMSTTSAYSAAQHLHGRWAEIERKQAALYQKHRPSFLHMRLTHSTSEQDAISEQIAQAFIEGTSTASLDQALAGMSTNDRGGSNRGGVGGFAETAGKVDDASSGQGQRTGSGTPTTSNGPSSSSVPLETFIRTFRTSRKVYHKRALWAERWTRGEVAWRED